MKIKTEDLVQDLIHRTNECIIEVKALKDISEKTLNRKANSDSWSALECLEHLNLYGDFYINEIKESIENSKFKNSSDLFKSGILGNYFAKSMLPKEKLNTMKTFKDKNPNGSSLTKGTIDRFLSQQQAYLVLLNKSNHVDLNKTKTSISISTWIKLKLGDTFRVVIYHHQRHLEPVSYYCWMY